MTTNKDDADFWTTRREAAAELSVILGEELTANSLMAWKRDPACPLPDGRGPIPKLALTTWATTQRRRNGGHVGVQSVEEAALRIQLLEAQVRNLTLKNEDLAAEMLPAEQVRVGIVRAVQDLKRQLTEEIPSGAWEALQGRTMAEAVPEIQALMITALNRFHDRAVGSGGP